MARLTSGSSHPPFFSKQIRFPPVVSSLSTTYHLVMTNTCFTKVSKSWTRETCRPTGNCCRCNHEIDPLWIHPSRFWLSIELSDDIWWSDMKDGEGSKLHFPPMASYGILWESYGHCLFLGAENIDVFSKGDPKAPSNHLFHLSVPWPWRRIPSGNLT
jgi:hypothetical protein